jgi:hypothetical protein
MLHELERLLENEAFLERCEVLRKREQMISLGSAVDDRKVGSIPVAQLPYSAQELEEIDQRIAELTSKL